MRIITDRWPACTNLFGAERRGRRSPATILTATATGRLQTGFQSPGDVGIQRLSVVARGPARTTRIISSRCLICLIPQKRPAGQPARFTNRLLSASNGVSAYDRGTLYRMLAQMGMDSAPESGKMNLNYDNLDPGSNGVLVAVGGTTSATNFVPWTPLNFFVNAADRLLKAYSAEWFAASPTNYLATYFSYLPQNYVAVNGYGLTNNPVPAPDQPGAGVEHRPNPRVGEQPLCLYARRPAPAATRGKPLRRHLDELLPVRLPPALQHERQRHVHQRLHHWLYKCQSDHKFKSAERFSIGGAHGRRQFAAGA